MKVSHWPCHYHLRSQEVLIHPEEEVKYCRGLSGLPWPSCSCCASLNQKAVWFLMSQGMWVIEIKRLLIEANRNLLLLMECLGGSHFLVMLVACGAVRTGWIHFRWRLHVRQNIYLNPLFFCFTLLTPAIYMSWVIRSKEDVPKYKCKWSPCSGHRLYIKIILLLTLFKTSVYMVSVANFRCSSIQRDARFVNYGFI